MLAMPSRNSSIYAALVSCEMDARYRDGGFWPGIDVRREVDVDRSCKRALSCDSRRFAAHFAAASLLRFARLILVRVVPKIIEVVQTDPPEWQRGRDCCEVL